MTSRVVESPTGTALERLISMKVSASVEAMYEHDRVIRTAAPSSSAATTRVTAEAGLTRSQNRRRQPPQSEAARDRLTTSTALADDRERSPSAPVIARHQGARPDRGRGCEAPRSTSTTGRGRPSRAHAAIKRRLDGATVGCGTAVTCQRATSARRRTPPHEGPRGTSAAGRRRSMALPQAATRGGHGAACANKAIGQARIQTSFNRTRSRAHRPAGQVIVWESPAPASSGIPQVDAVRRAGDRRRSRPQGIDTASGVEASSGPGFRSRHRDRSLQTAGLEIIGVKDVSRRPTTGCAPRRSEV
jgi:hypothetical protein